MRHESDIVKLGVVGLAERYRDGSLSPTAVTEFYLSQIAIHNPRINAVLDLYTQEAHRSAQASAQRYKSGKPLSPLDGVPLGVKANIAVKGQVCHGGIKAYTANIAQEDADVVSRLKAAGAIILGSLNMEEGALGAATDNPWFGKTFNPLKQGYTPGGSSGGSAAAVASGMMPAALGTDTMGSVRIPSAYCGLAGHKPTTGSVSFDGIMALSPTLDCVGPHARTVEDVQSVMSVLTGNSLDQTIPTPITVGKLDWAADVDVEPAVQNAFDQAVSALEKSGFIINTIRLDGYDFGKTRRAGLLVSEVEGAEVHVETYRNDPSGFSEHFQSLLSWGVAQSREKVEAAYDLLDIQKQRANKIFESCDVLIAPTAPQRAFKFGSSIPANQADFTAFANFAGLPATAIPIETDGLPASVQIVGPHGRDALTMSVAAKLSRII